MIQKKKLFKIVLLVALISGATSLLIPSSRATIFAKANETYAQLTSESNSAFPVIEDGNLSVTQEALLRVLRYEYAHRPVSYDQYVLEYTDGNKEAWCADFISWTMKQSGIPLKNPNSGNWRIPGVLTLQEYYKNQARYIAASDKYIPKTGDVAIFIGEKTPDGRSRQHASIVLDVVGSQMTTIGGNEQGRMRISVRDFKAKESNLVGFGTLPKTEQK